MACISKIAWCIQEPSRTPSIKIFLMTFKLLTSLIFQPLIMNIILSRVNNLAVLPADRPGGIFWNMYYYVYILHVPSQDVLVPSRTCACTLTFPSPSHLSLLPPLICRPHCNNLLAVGASTGVLLWNVDPTVATTRYIA